MGDLKPGDVVALKSGGPHMTVILVEGIVDPITITARYFLSDGPSHVEVFGECQLRLISADEPESTFGIPEALMKAKDDERQRLMDERDRQYAEDQVRYAHTSGYVDEADQAGVTRAGDG